MTTFLPAEKGMPIRMPATANLMIDSTDRDEVRFNSSADFQITKPNSILNGFFTRIGTTEVVLEWNTFNLVGKTLTVDVSGGTSTTYILFAGFYTVAQLMDYVVARLEAKLPGTTWDVVNNPSGFSGRAIAIQTGAPVTFRLSGAVADLLKISSTTYTTYATGGGLTVPLNVDLRRYRYLDFVSGQLTYCQDLKDTSTAPIVRDVLCRWYMAWDNEPLLDAYGYPILMGYTPFTLRRTFSPPKQIRWDNIQPIGNLSFQVYGDDGQLAAMRGGGSNPQLSEWLMTLQVTEN